jgi:uncharacterized phage protein gp47/JayE
MSYGLLPTGLHPKTLEVLKEEIEAAEKANINPALNVSATSVLGQLNGIFASKLQELWDLGQSVYQAFDPEQATGSALDALSALTGTLRLRATRSRVTATVNLNAGTTLPAGSVASVSGPGARFRTLEEVTNSGASPDDFPVLMRAEEYGPVVANAGTLTVIETPVSGWNSVTNVLDATLGRNLENDANLRLRREDEIRATGAGSFEAVLADLKAVENVKAVLLFENFTDITNGDGLPPKSFEAVVQGGLDQDIRDAIWETKPLGIRAFGTTSGTVTDSQGNTHTIEFTRPTVIPLHVAVTVVTNPLQFPIDGEQQVKDAIVAHALANYTIGVSVILAGLYPPIMGVPGVKDITSLKVDNVTPPVASGNYVIGARQLADFDTSRIVVTVV